jgi:S1-C subfamily serine protease
VQTVDGLLGAALTGCVGLGIAWILGAVALQSSARKDVQRSAILRELNQLLPPAGPILHALARIDPLPSVRGPAAEVPPPSNAILGARGVHGARRSVVKILGTACGLGIEGSGWVAAPGLVVTNAHVVGGETDTQVEIGGNGPSLGATVVAFNTHDDIAVLEVRQLGLAPLALARDPNPGTAAAILGYPEDSPTLVTDAGRLGQTQLTDTQDAYGNGPVMRRIVALRGLVQPGNSGGPLVDASGRVLATVFAAITNASGAITGNGGFAVPNSLVRTELRHAEARRVAVGTGPCAG